LDLSGFVHAAGGVPWRWNDGEVEVLLVHRPRYDDWTLPKGKVQSGESDEQAALREVEEETGLRCELGAELAGTMYRDRKLRPKLVRYWAMRPVAGDAVAQHEVDEVAWMRLDHAAGRLSYERDLDVLASLDRVL
jgi:8-oxo-dGTP diphosphatase